MHALSSECCTRCCHHHVFGEQYKSCHYNGLRDKSMIQGEENEKKDRQRFDAVFDAHQKRVRSFCAVIEKKLLPEIRGIVYEHLLSNCATQYVIESFAPSVHHYGHSCLSYFFPKSRLPADPGTRTDVWRFIDYTGDIIGKEIAEAWYQTSRFIIYLGDGLVDQWLSEDVWGRGMVPADLIRNVYVHIPEAACYSLEVKKSNKRHSAREELNLLKRLGNKRVDLTIELEVMTMIALRAVADSVYELQSRRFVDVKVRAYCSLDCNMRANGRFFGVRKDLCSSGCNMKDVGYLFNVRKEVFDELFGETSTCLESEASDVHDHRFWWVRAILGGNPEAIDRYAEYPDGKERTFFDYSWRKEYWEGR